MQVSKHANNILLIWKVIPHIATAAYISVDDWYILTETSLENT